MSHFLFLFLFAIPNLHLSTIHFVTMIRFELLCRHGYFCHNVKELLCVGLHWRVPFIEVLSETVQVVW